MLVIFSAGVIANTNQGSSNTSLLLQLWYHWSNYISCNSEFLGHNLPTERRKRENKVPYRCLLCTDVSARFIGDALKLKPNKEHNFSIYNKQKLKQMSLAEVIKQLCATK